MLGKYDSILLSAFTLKLSFHLASLASFKTVIGHTKTYSTHGDPNMTETGEFKSHTKLTKISISLGTLYWFPVYLY